MIAELSIALLIVFVCLLLHVTGLFLTAEWLFRSRELVDRDYMRLRAGILLIVLFCSILLLHMLNVGFFAVFYYSRRLFDDFESSLYFSFTSYTTLGYGDMLLPRRWRLLGTVEGLCGLLMCGVSTAFFFAVMNAIFQIRLQRAGFTTDVTVR